jgi:integrase
VANSGSRWLSLVKPPTAQVDEPGSDVLVDTGLADVVRLQRQAAASLADGDEESFFHDTLMEYMWARDVAGLAPKTLHDLPKPVIEICDFYDLMPWRVTPRHLDRYFAGPGKRATATVRGKLLRIDSYFAFLEQRYAGEIARRFGVSVESPVDAFNRPIHRGDFGLRIPPSKRALREFFGSWRAELPNARKYPVAVRDYVMAKLTYISAVRASELCAVRIGDLHWELGQWGRFVVQGKGARGSGPRERQAYLFQDGRELLWWYMVEIRGEFCDDPLDPDAPLFPSERLPEGIAALNLPIAPPVGADAFRKALKAASQLYLPGPVRHVFPHLLRHACATHHYEDGMPLWDVQQVLGHRWATTTVGYLSSVKADPEKASMEASRRAIQRLKGRA